MKKRCAFFLQSYFLVCVAWMSGVLADKPPEEMPEALRSAFTFDGKILEDKWYWDGTVSSSAPIRYTKGEMQMYLGYAAKRLTLYYGETDRYLYRALNKHRKLIRGQEVGIIGSTIPWYEAIILCYGGKPITIDYNPIKSEDPRVRTMTVAEYQENPQQFDVLLSISSFEHDGLGRYGDPIDPDGDIKAMQTCAEMLRPGGILILAIPIGQDCVVWNAHRIYGKIRTPLLLKGWKQIDFFGQHRTPERGFSLPYNRDSWRYQPIMVLQRESDE